MSPDSTTPDRDALVADIEATRDRLAATTDALAAKVDVKGQAQAKVEEVKAQTSAVVDRAGAKVQDVSAGAPGTGTQQSGVLLGAVVVATALAVWLVVRRR